MKISTVTDAEFQELARKKSKDGVYRPVYEALIKDRRVRVEEAPRQIMSTLRTHFKRMGQTAHFRWTDETTVLIWLEETELTL